MGGKRATSTIEVGRLAGVSHMTVARVFAGKGYVAEKTRQRVLRAAAELNYVPNPLASGLRGGQTRSVGILWGLRHPPSAATVAADLADRIRNHGYAPYLVNHERSVTVTCNMLSTASAVTS